MNAVIELAEAFDAMAKKEGNHTVSVYWAGVFQCDDGSPDLFIAVAALHAKLRKAISVIEASDMKERSKGLFLQALHALQPYVVASQISNTERRHISAQRQNIDVLFLAGDVYPDEAAPVINPLTLQALEEELRELVREVQRSDMPMLLRHAVETQLSTLLLAVRGYDVLGQEGFAKIYGSAAFGLTQAAQAAPPADANSTSLFKKALGVCKKAGAALVWASATTAAVHGILESGADIGGQIGIFPSDDGDAKTPKGK